MPADRMSGDRMPTAEEVEVLIGVASFADTGEFGGEKKAIASCFNAGWFEMAGPPPSVWLTPGGMRALAAYRAAHGEGRG